MTFKSFTLSLSAVLMSFFVLTGCSSDSPTQPDPVDTGDTGDTGDLPPPASRYEITLEFDEIEG